MVFCTSKIGISLAGGLAYEWCCHPHIYVGRRSTYTSYVLDGLKLLKRPSRRTLSIEYCCRGFLYAHTFVYVYGLYRCIYHRISIYSWTVLVVYFFVQRSEFPWDSTVYIRIYTYDIYIYMHICIPCVCILYVYVVISTGISWYKNPQPGLGIVSRINRRAPVKVDHVVAGCLCLARHLDTESRMDARAPVKVDQVVTSSSAWTWGVMEMKLTLVGGAIVMTLLLPNWGKENGLMLLERAMNCLTGKLGGWNSMKGFLHVARVTSATRALYSALLYISLHVFLRSRAMGMGTVWFEQELCASWGLVFLFLLFWGQAGEQVQHFVGLPAHRWSYHKLSKHHTAAPSRCSAGTCWGCDPPSHSHNVNWLFTSTSTGNIQY